MLVRLLVLITLGLLVLAPGDPLGATFFVDEVSLLESEPEPSSEVFEVEYVIVRAIPHRSGAPAEILLVPPRALDTGGVFRPPRVLAA